MHRKEDRSTSGELVAIGRETGIAVGAPGKQGVVDAAGQMLLIVSSG